MKCHLRYHILITILGTKVEKPSEIPNLKSHLRFQKSEVPNLKSHLRYQQSEVPNLKSHLRYQKSEVPNLRSYLRYQRSEVPNLKSHLRYQKNYHPPRVTPHTLKPPPPYLQVHPCCIVDQLSVLHVDL